MAARTIDQNARLPDFLRAASAAPSNPVLHCKGLVKHFGGIHAVDGLDLAVRPASIHALLGPNGAGKTTAFNLISGMFPPDAGEIRLFEERIDGHPPDEITQRGLARSFQITNLFKRLTIEENIRLGIQGKHAKRMSALAAAHGIEEINRETAELIAFLGLKGIVIKSHGGTDAVGFASAAELGYEMAREDLMAKVREMVAASTRPELPVAQPADAE